MKIKMIVTDLDNTLLHTDKTISSYSKWIFNECKKMGIKIVFATARPFRNLESFTKIIEPDITICHNGTSAYEGDKLLFSNRIQNNQAIEILLKLQQIYPTKELSCEMDETNYANYDITQDYPGYYGLISDFTDMPNKDVDKIIADIENHSEHIQEIREIISKDLYVEISDNKIAMIMNKIATKQAGVARIGKRYNISKENIVAFGDDYNDIGMIEYCSIGVAVANALTQVKAVANYITLTNNMDGVAKFLEEHIL